MYRPVLEFLIFSFLFLLCVILIILFGSTHSYARPLCNPGYTYCIPQYPIPQYCVPRYCIPYHRRYGYCRYSRRYNLWRRELWHARHRYLRLRRFTPWGRHRNCPKD